MFIFIVGKDQILSKMISTTTADEGGPKEAKMQGCIHFVIIFFTDFHLYN